MLLHISRLFLVWSWISGLLVLADFVYTTFDDTEGLVFNGAAGTSSCITVPKLEYGDVQGHADQFSPDPPVETTETNGIAQQTTRLTNNVSAVANSTKLLAGFGNNPKAKHSPTEQCSVRARLTPSRGRIAGSMWYKLRVPITQAFETMFTFQITDQTRQCTKHKDVLFSTLLHETCTVKGGDGFAFVIHEDVKGTRAVGRNGGHLGFGGLRNSIAIAFDTWYNPGEDKDVIVQDHISVQSMGPEQNSGYEIARFGLPAVHDLADGLVHLVKIVYFSELKVEYLEQMSATENMVPFLKDGGEGKRIGTLAIFIDEGIELGKPLIAIPLNMAILLDLPVEDAVVGFTASTGRAWQKHDILSWYWCDEEPCEKPKRDEFDYYQQAEFYTGVTLRKNTPGPGYSGGATRWPAKQQSFNNEPYGPPQTHFAPTKPEGLYSKAYLQVPPNTAV